VFSSILCVYDPFELARRALSDAEIGDRGLSELSASALQEISMLLTAEKIELCDPKAEAAYYTVEAGLNDFIKFASAADYRVLRKGASTPLKLFEVYLL
jgi:hypothetical protein